MRNSRPVILFTFLVATILLAPHAYASPVTVSISPSTQVVPQGTAGTYTVSLSGALASSYTLTVSGLSGSGAFSPNPVSTPSGSGNSTLSVATTSAPGLYCPGSYAFTVTAANATSFGSGPPDTGSAAGTLTVIRVGPPLSVSLTTDKSTYTIGDTVTILISANRMAEGHLTISPPSGPPLVFNYQLLYGPYSLTKTLTASSVGHWTVLFQADDFCGGVSSSQGSFDVSPNTYDVSLSLNGVPSQYSAQLQVDGQPQGTIGGGQIEKLTFSLNTSHTVSVDQVVPGNTGVRYYCAQNTLNVTSSGSFTFSYQTQYQFTVQAEPSGITQVGGGGWFMAGATVQTSLAPTVIAGPTGVQYAFKGWEINGSPQFGNPISLTLNMPYTALANYSTQYQLTVDSEYGNPQGAGYYDAGSTAQFSVTTPWGFPIQQVFSGWQGDYTGTSPQGSITMDKPYVVHATWTTSYLPLIAIIVVAGAIVGGLLFWRSRRTPPAETKPTPSPPTQTQEGMAIAAQVAKCQNCGAENMANQKFCTTCGEKLASQGKD